MRFAERPGRFFWESLIISRMKSAIFSAHRLGDVMAISMITQAVTINWVVTILVARSLSQVGMPVCLTAMAAMSAMMMR